MFEEEYADLDSVPQSVRHLFTEKSGKHVLIGAGEIKTIDDVLRVQEGLRKEREDHKENKRKLLKFNGLDPEEIHAKLDRFDELESAAGGKIDETKISEMVETRLKTRTAPLERQISALMGERDDALGSVSEYKTRDTTRTIHDEIRKAGVQANIRDTAMDDAMLIGGSVFTINDDGRVVTKFGVGVTPDVDPATWLTEVKSSRPHWWPESQGAGARGGSGRNSGTNPFSHDGWNMTEQGKMIRADRSRAEQMAKSAGTVIGGARPSK